MLDSERAVLFLTRMGRFFNNMFVLFCFLSFLNGSIHHRSGTLFTPSPDLDERVHRAAVKLLFCAEIYGIDKHIIGCIVFFNHHTISVCIHITSGDMSSGWPLLIRDMYISNVIFMINMIQYGIKNISDIAVCTLCDPSIS